MLKRNKWSVCLPMVFAFTSTVLAHTTQLETVVSSSAGQQSVYEVAQPVTVLDKEAINNNAGATLGTLLENTAGIANASFGAGVGRPVIRGMSGSRVKILQNGSDSSDLSAMSSDHAPMAEATSAEQVEVIYGPATLLYGGGAIGGVVNLIDRRIHELPQAGVSVDLGVKHSSVDQGYQSDAMLDMGKGHWVMHLDGFKRDAKDYHSGKSSDAPAGHNKGKVANSDSQGQGGAVALSWADGQHGFVGASISTLDYDYAVPNTTASQFRVEPKQTRYDVKGAWLPAATSSWGWIDEWRTELSFNDYQHAETGEKEDVPGAAIVDVGLFDQESWELQSRIRHQFWRGWQGTVGVQAKLQKLRLCHDHHGCEGIANVSAAWSGAQGSGFAQREGYLFAHDTPMPLTETQQVSLYAVEQRDWDSGVLELGARVDKIQIESTPSSINLNYRQEQSYYANKTFTPTTISAAGTWILSPQQRLGLSLARVERAPEAPELFWNGDHHATFAFQLDNPDLSKETAYTADVNWLYQSTQHQLRAALYYYEFQNYIYNDLKTVTDPFHGEDVYRHEQADAHFVGGELNWQYNFLAFWHLDVNADWVSAKRSTGEKLPRTPPASMLVALNWEKNGWDARVETRAVMQQKQVAATENSTAGFVVLNASWGYQQRLPQGELHWQLSAQNLTDEYRLNHVSYLKHAAPLPGRNVQVGVRYTF